MWPLGRHEVYWANHLLILQRGPTEIIRSLSAFDLIIREFTLYCQHARFCLPTSGKCRFYSSPKYAARIRGFSRTSCAVPERTTRPVSNT